MAVVEKSAHMNPHLNFQANLKRFMEHVHQKNVEKVSKWLEKGLDPNFHDSDSGGERQHTSKRSLIFGENILSHSAPSERGVGVLQLA